MGKNKNTINDPYAQREAKKYDDPIPSREYILEFLEKKGSPIDYGVFLNSFNIKAKDNKRKKAVKNRLKAMVRDKQLKIVDGSYWIRGRFFLVEGKVFTEKGNKYIKYQKRKIKLLNARKAFTGDEVSVELLDVKEESNWFNRGYINKINTKIEVTGYVDNFRKTFYLIPTDKKHNHRVKIEKLEKAKVGDKVVCSVDRDTGTGDVIKVIANKSYAGIEIESTIEEFDLRTTFPKKAVKETKELPKISARGREDLRHLDFVTIDGDDSKDFDDAVYCIKRKNGFKLYVAIADVAYYVKEDSELDKEAKLRGNSVYFPNKVLPMLPEALSNKLCSLVPHEDRLTVVCEMNISLDGKVTRYKFYNAIINSSARLTYNKVFEFLSDKLDFDENVAENVENLHEVYKKLIKTREQRGAIEFDTVDTYIIFNDKQQIESIQPVVRNVAHKIIEECMLSANVCAAKLLIKNKIPAVFRNHDRPADERIEDLKEFLKGFRLKFKATKPTPKDYNTLLKKIRRKESSRVFELVMLRSLMQAVYAVKNEGHFGLAYEEYTHFTSPIRRYADLIVHRQIKKIISNKWDKQRKSKTKYMASKIQKEKLELESTASHISATERVAEDAGRTAVKWLKCKYVSKFIGKKFHAMITGVTGFGFFAELDDLYVDGLVHISSLNDYFHHVPEEHKLIGEHSGEEYCLGDRVYVMIKDVCVETRRIDFELI